jgi:hypothetical protein
VVQECVSRFSSLAAGRLPVRRSLRGGGSAAHSGCRSSSHILTSPLKTRVRGSARRSPGRRSCPGPQVHGTATGCRACAHKTASGRRRWPNRDPLGIKGGVNLYSFVGNEPIQTIDLDGLLKYKFGWPVIAGGAARLLVSIVQAYDNAQCAQKENCALCCNGTAAALGLTCAGTAIAGGLVTGGMFGAIPVIGPIVGPVTGLVSGGSIASECGVEVNMGRAACLAKCPQNPSKPKSPPPGAYYPPGGSRNSPPAVVIQ